MLGYMCPAPGPDAPPPHGMVPHLGEAEARLFLAFLSFSGPSMRIETFGVPINPKLGTLRPKLILSSFQYATLAHFHCVLHRFRTSCLRSH